MTGWSLLLGAVGGFVGGATVLVLLVVAVKAALRARFPQRKEAP